MRDVHEHTDGSLEEDLSTSSPSGVGVRRVGVIAVALLVFVAPLLYAWRGARTDQPSASPLPAQADSLANIARGWTELPLAPQPADGAASVWTGTELVSWGGYLTDPSTKSDTYTAAGFAFDPSSSTWNPIPTAPGGRADAIPIWTGSEALFLFGHDDSKGFTDGFAFDPASGSWRTIAEAPIDPYVMTAVWTGKEVIAWGSRAHDAKNGGNEGATYDPETDTWQRIASAPIQLNAASSVWTGTQMIVLGALLDSGNHAATETAIGASYSPAEDAWTELPPSSLVPQATTAAWAGDRMLAWDYLMHAQTLETDTNTWARPVRMPLDASECYPDSVALTDSVFGFSCGDAGLYDDANGTWKELHGGMLDATVDEHGNAIKLWRFAELTSAGDAVFIRADGITLTDNGTPCYGCSGSPMSFWVFRP